MINTPFKQLTDKLEAEVATLPPSKRALFLLTYAQRYRPVFALFEKRAPKRAANLDRILDELWAIAGGQRATPGLEWELERLIPGEEWVVDGFYDALAQDIGAMAVGALQGLCGSGIDRHPESAVFDLVRLLLSEMRLGCSEPGDDMTGRTFDSQLHNEKLVVEEAGFWRTLVDQLKNERVAAKDLRQLALAHSFDPARLEPELSRGLEEDAANSRGP